MYLETGDIVPFLTENRKVGGILKFVESDQLILEGLTQNKKFLQYLLYYVSSPLNHFYYYFLASFEQKLYDILIIRKEQINLNQFCTLIHAHVRDRYLKNVHGDEKELWATNGKSIDKTITCFLKSYDASYIHYLHGKNYKQLAELAFDIYLYFPVFGGESDFKTFLDHYKKFLREEWKPILFENVKPMNDWMYGSRFKEVQIHNTIET